MQIAEIFYSLQGEGPHLGKPAVFLRLAGCNLRCKWCDTKYSWDLKSGEKMTTAQILKEIKKFPTKHLVITGGEPLIQQSALAELLERLQDYYVEIETSGSLATHLNKYIDQYNCSPKPAAEIKKFPKQKTYYKFVVDTPKDIMEIKSFIRRHRIPKERTLLMPQGTKARELAEKSQWLAEICKEENLRFTPRLHINLWGNKRKH